MMVNVHGYAWACGNVCTWTCCELPGNSALRVYVWNEFEFYGKYRTRTLMVVGSRLKALRGYADVIRYVQECWHGVVWKFLIVVSELG